MFNRSLNQVFRFDFVKNFSKFLALVVLCQSWIVIAAYSFRTATKAIAIVLTPHQLTKTPILLALSNSKLTNVLVPTN